MQGYEHSPNRAAMDKRDTKENLVYVSEFLSVLVFFFFVMTCMSDEQRMKFLLNYILAIILCLNVTWAKGQHMRVQALSDGMYKWGRRAGRKTKPCLLVTALLAGSTAASVTENGAATSRGSKSPWAGQSGCQWGDSPDINGLDLGGRVEGDPFKALSSLFTGALGPGASRECGVELEAGRGNCLEGGHSLTWGLTLGQPETSRASSQTRGAPATAKPVGHRAYYWQVVALGQPQFLISQQ